MSQRDYLKARLHLASSLGYRKGNVLSPRLEFGFSFLNRFFFYSVCSQAIKGRLQDCVDIYTHIAMLTLEELCNLNFSKSVLNDGS